MRQIPNFVLAVIGILLAMEGTYRVALYIEHPDRFSKPLSYFGVSDKSMWRYNKELGYEYVPDDPITTTVIRDNAVVDCITKIEVNRQGNIGPEVADYFDAPVRIALFGDSFSAEAIDGVSWPFLFQQEMEATLGKSVRVMNLARDGYGILQMFDAAAVKISQYRPTFVMFAFNSPGLQRDRTWRGVIGDGAASRGVASLTPDLADPVDIMYLDPRATPEWCASAKQGQHSPLLDRIIEKAVTINSAREDTFDIFSPTESLILRRLTNVNPLQPKRGAASPLSAVTALKKYDSNERFVADLTAIKQSGVPFEIIHLPIGISLGTGQGSWIPDGAQSLYLSLESLTGQPILKLEDIMRAEPEEAIKLCLSAADCHPSKLGMAAYAHAATSMIAPHFMH
jgi:hypothetical protein